MYLSNVLGNIYKLSYYQKKRREEEHCTFAGIFVQNFGIFFNVFPVVPSQRINLEEVLQNNGCNNSDNCFYGT